MSLDAGNSPIFPAPSEAQQAAFRENMGINSNIGTSTAAALARRAVAGGVQVSAGGGITATDLNTVPSSFTYSGYLKVPVLGDFRWASQVGASSRAWDVRVNANGRFQVNLYDNGGTANQTQYYSINGIVKAGQGVFVSFTLDGTAPKLFVNGFEVSLPTVTVIGTGFSAFSSATNFYLVLGAFDNNFNSVVTHTRRDEAFFNTALTAAQALEIYNAGSAEAWLAENPEYRWGVGGNQITNIARNSDFSDVATDWTKAGAGSVTLNTGTNALDVVSNGANDRAVLTEASFNFTDLATIRGKRVRVTLNVTAITATWTLRFGITTTASATLSGSTGVQSYELTVDSVADTDFQIRSTTAGTISFTDISFELVGALACLPLTDDCRQLRDISPNRYDATASATGVTHLKQKDTHVFRADGATGTGSPYLIAASDILAPNEVVTGVTVDGRYYAASGAQTDSYRRIQLVINASNIDVKRSNGTSVETIASTTPTSTTNFDIAVITQRI